MLLVAAAKGLILRAACFEVSPEGSMKEGKEEVDTMEGGTASPPSPPLPLLAWTRVGEEDSLLTALSATGLP